MDGTEKYCGEKGVKRPPLFFYNDNDDDDEGDDDDKRCRIRRLDVLA
jgi:hypothetical protein